MSKDFKQGGSYVVCKQSSGRAENKKKQDGFIEIQKKLKEKVSFH